MWACPNSSQTTANQGKVLFHTEGVVERLLRTQCMLLIDQGDLGRWGENGIRPIKTVVADSVFFKEKVQFEKCHNFFCKNYFHIEYYTYPGPRKVSRH